MSVIHVRSKDGTKIAVDEVGVGRPIVIVHGATVDRAVWAKVATLLADRFRVFTFDRRGRGDSEDAVEYEPAREAEDLIAVVRPIDGPVVLFGHSSGGIITLQAVEQLSSVDRLVLYEPPVFIGSARRPSDLAARLMTLLRTGDRDGVARTFLREGFGWPNAQVDQVAGSPRWPALLGLAHTMPYDMQVQSEYVFDSGRLAAIRIPTLFLLGSDSPPEMRSGTEALAAAIRESEIRELPGQGHIAHVTAPGLLADEVTRFLS
jgi:pimeloyl-ACP methyl ester carboxylesterase